MYIEKKVWGKLIWLFQITYIGGIIHATADNNFQIMAGSASFLTPYMSLGKILFRDWFLCK